jgi:hypothetical protein
MRCVHPCSPTVVAVQLMKGTRMFYGQFERESNWHLGGELVASAVLRHPAACWTASIKVIKSGAYCREQLGAPRSSAAAVVIERCPRETLVSVQEVASRRGPHRVYNSQSMDPILSQLNRVLPSHSTPTPVSPHLAFVFLVFRSMFLYATLIWYFSHIPTNLCSIACVSFGEQYT